MGEVRQRGRIWWIRYYRNGRRHEESARTEKRTEAERLLKMREGDVAHGVPMTSRIGQLRYEEAAADFLNDNQVNGRRAYNLRDSPVRALTAGSLSTVCGIVVPHAENADFHHGSWAIWALKEGTCDAVCQETAMNTDSGRRDA